MDSSRFLEGNHLYSPEETVKPKPLPQTRKPHPNSMDRVSDMESALTRRSPSKGEEEGQDMDLKVSITEREKTEVKSEIFIRYKICTEVRGVVISDL